MMSACESHGIAQPPRKSVVTSAADHHDLDELGHVEEPEAHARVLEVVAGDDLGLALGRVEGRRACSRP